MVQSERSDRLTQDRGATRAYTAIKDMPPHFIHHKCLPRGVYTYSVSLPTSALHRDSRL